MLNVLGLTGVVTSLAIQHAETEKLKATESQFFQWERRLTWAMLIPQ